MYFSDTDENLSDSKDDDTDVGDNTAPLVEETTPQEKNLKAVKRNLTKENCSVPRMTLTFPCFKSYSIVFRIVTH